MTKENIPQYSATAASNTDVQDIDIAENCAPSGINNAIREIMADLKDQDTGAVAMTSPVLTTADINGGTADNITIGGSTPAAGTFTTVTTSGEITANGGIALGDNDKATFGDGDLEIYHNASDSFVSAVGTGDLIIQTSTDDKDVKIKSDDGAGGLAEYFRADGSLGQAQMYYYGSMKLATTSTGIAVTGNIDSSDISNFSATYNDFSGDGLHIQSTGTSGNGAYAGGISFSRISSDNNSRAAGIAAVQTDTDIDKVGLAFFTHPDATTSNDLSEAMRIDASGNVGIGTDSPSSPLSLDVTAGTVPVYVDTNITSGEGSVDIIRAYTVNDEYSAITLVREGSSNTGLAFTTTGTSTPAEVMRIDSSGNVGIGEDAPNSKLRVKDDDTTVATLESTGDNSFISFVDTGTNSRTHVQIGSEDNAMVFHTGGSESMQIDASGHAIIPTGVTLGTATGVYSANNTLDDYEEGSYTVQLFDASSGGNASSTSVTGRYTKIGNQVTVRFDSLNNIDTTGMTGANDLYFSLPFSSGATGRSAGSVIFDTLAFVSGRTMVTPMVVDGASRGQFRTTGGGVTDQITEIQDINSGSTDIMTFTLTYFTD